MELGVVAGTGARLAVVAEGAKVRCWEAELFFGWGVAPALNSLCNLEQVLYCVFVCFPHL